MSSYGVFRPLADIDTIVIHCSASPNGLASITETDLDAWHVARGWQRDQEARQRLNQHLLAIGYHRIIRADGTVASGRALDEVGAHAPAVTAKNYRGNQHSIGICVIGTDKFTAGQWGALRNEVAELVASLPSGNGLRVVGHRDVDWRQPPKTCPGFDVREWLGRGMVPESGKVLG